MSFNGAPSAVRGDSGLTTKHQFTIQTCNNPKCRFTGEQNHHQSGVCVHCGVGGVTIKLRKAQFVHRRGK